MRRREEEEEEEEESAGDECRVRRGFKAKEVAAQEHLIIIRTQWVANSIAEALEISSKGRANPAKEFLHHG